jgi:hypothetical protein
MDNVDVKAIVKDEIDKFVNSALDKEVKKILKKSGSQTRDEMINSIRDGFESVFKVLWQRKDFWKQSIR